MKKIFITLILLIILTPVAVSAKITAKCTIEKITQHKLLVTFSWEVTVYSDKNWDACDLTISFHDIRGHEIHSISERIELKTGKNIFEGHEIVHTDVWERIRKHVATIDCVFRSQATGAGFCPARVSLIFFFHNILFRHFMPDSIHLTCGNPLHKASLSRPGSMIST